MQNTLVLSVSQLNRYIKMNFDADENLANIFYKRRNIQFYKSLSHGSPLFYVKG